MDFQSHNDCGAGIDTGATSATAAGSNSHGQSGNRDGRNQQHKQVTSSSATISANDFLTLLVTEMQNQDPTADTDPNEYINQLVQVNSLEQLIDINQNLSTVLGDSSPSSGGTGSSQATGASRALASASPAGTAGRSASQASTARSASGNLSVPNASPSADRVAHALDGNVLGGRSNARTIAAGLPGAQ